MRDLLKRLVKDVKEMRDLQKEYFKTRDKNLLKYAKAKEMIVDDDIKVIESNLEEEK